MKYSVERFRESKTEIRFVYFVDIFAHLNRLNVELRGFDNVKPEGKVFVNKNKTHALFCKINIRVDKTKTSNYSVFLTPRTLLDDGHYNSFTDNTFRTMYMRLFGNSIGSISTRCFRKYGIVE